MVVVVVVEEEDSGRTDRLRMACEESEARQEGEEEMGMERVGLPLIQRSSLTSSVAMGLAGRTRWRSVCWDDCVLGKDSHRRDEDEEKDEVEVEVDEEEEEEEEEEEVVGAEAMPERRMR